MDDPGSGQSRYIRNEEEANSMTRISNYQRNIC
jgi:hypothetical protein